MSLAILLITRNPQLSYKSQNKDQNKVILLLHHGRGCIYPDKPEFRNISIEN